ncbi:MAG: DUF551 domain-containing protein [Thiobacillus sp.]|uniref:DUF551 domain-containing protein n=1 Tax=Thiobacillus sp. TaxID=924 RepID=UPI002894D63F|nr:DUF551 domain-containing protein [Thiobacillus sp.]MDT3708139.1 DUF551 domain-containing protein [Thiobacillus sp.]
MSDDCFSAHDMADNAANAFRNAVPEGSAVVRWISATERLPDDDQTVLIAMDDGEVWTGYMDAGEWRYVSSEPISYAHITHWMEFPEPPDA